MSDTHPIYYSRPQKLVEAEEAIAAENAKVLAQIGTISKQVEVQELPESYFKERLMLIAKSPSSKVWVVAKDGVIHDWACYIGFPDEMSEYGITQDPTGWYRQQLTHWQGVLRNGDKVDEATARTLFPEKASQSYRS